MYYFAYKMQSKLKLFFILSFYSTVRGYNFENLRKSSWRKTTLPTYVAFCLSNLFIGRPLFPCMVGSGTIAGWRGRARGLFSPNESIGRDKLLSRPYAIDKNSMLEGLTSVRWPPPFAVAESSIGCSKLVVHEQRNTRDDCHYRYYTLSWFTRATVNNANLLYEHVSIHIYVLPRNIVCSTQYLSYLNA